MQYQPIAHWDHRWMQNDADTAAASTLLRGLFSAGVLRRYRAHYFAQGNLPGARQAVLIDLDEPRALGSEFEGMRCLWLIEQLNGQICLLGSQVSPSIRRIAGDVLREKGILDSDSELVRCLSRIGAQRTFARLPADSRTPAEPRQIALLADIEQRVLVRAISLFAQALRRDVMEAVAREGAFTPESYNHYLDAAGHLDRYRAQAATAFPLFSPVLRQDPQLRGAVDSGKPLARALAGHFGVQPRTVQRMRELAPTLVPPDELPVLLDRVDQLPAEYLPKTDLDWAAFLRLGTSLADLSRTLDVPFSHIAQPFLNGWHQGQQALLAEFGGAFNTTAIYDMMQATYRYGVWPPICRMPHLSALGETPPVGFFALWFGRCSLRRLLELTARWQDAHRRFSLNRLGVIGPDLGQQLQWPKLVPVRGHRHGEYIVVELNSHNSLELEGRIQKNCLASYTIKCVRAESAIYSIRDRRTGQPLSTFEIGLEGDRPELLQHHGPSNAPPSAQLQALADRFVQRVLSTLTPARFTDVRRRRRASGQRVAARLAAPNTPATPYTAGETARLAELVAFAHPREVRQTTQSGTFRLDGARAASLLQSRLADPEAIPMPRAA